MTYKDIPGYCNYHDFYKKVFEELPDGANIAEVGVFKGHSVVYMATLAKESRKQITIYAVDTFMGSIEHKEQGITDYYDEFCVNIHACGVSKYVVPVPAASVCAVKFDYIPDLDFVFIDADHSYEAVKKDIEAWYLKVKKGGIFAGHDYRASPDVKKAVDEFILKNILTLNYNFKENVWMTKK